MTPRAKIIAVCSDQARNGKTLVARLVADYLVLAGRNPLIFDANPTGDGIRTWLPERSFPVDLFKTMGQIQIFDRILTLPYRDHIIDVAASQFEKFFETMAEIGFVAEAQANRFAVGAFFVVDRALTSLDTARRMRDALKLDGFYPVRNAAVGDVTSDGQALGAFALAAQDGDLALPEMHGDLVARVQKPGFSFSGFLKEERSLGMTLREREMMDAYLDQVMEQVDGLMTRLDETAARRMRAS